jgi:hypothetical protein
MVFAGAFAGAPSFVAAIIATPPSLQQGGRADRLSKIRHSRKLA